MTQHPNAGLLRKSYEAFAKRDMATVDTLFSDDIHWHNHGSSLISGDYAGKDAVFGMFARLLELTGGTGGRFEVHDIVADDEHAVSLLRARSSRPGTGKQLDVKEIHVCHVHNGKISEVWVFTEDQRVNDEYWS